MFGTMKLQSPSGSDVQDAPNCVPPVSAVKRPRTTPARGVTSRMATRSAPTRTLITDCVGPGSGMDSGEMAPGWSSASDAGALSGALASSVGSALSDSSSEAEGEEDWSVASDAPSDAVSSVASGAVGLLDSVASGLAESVASGDDSLVVSGVASAGSLAKALTLGSGDGSAAMAGRATVPTINATEVAPASQLRVAPPSDPNSPRVDLNTVPPRCHTGDRRRFVGSYSRGAPRCPSGGRRMTGDMGGDNRVLALP